MTTTETDTPGEATLRCSGDTGHVCRRTVLASAGAVGVGVALAGCGAAGEAASNAASKAGDAASSAVSEAILATRTEHSVLVVEASCTMQSSCRRSSARHVCAI